jgi:hypothetical protein
MSIIVPWAKSCLKSCVSGKKEKNVWSLPTVVNVHVSGHIGCMSAIHFKITMIFGFLHQDAFYTKMHILILIYVPVITGI